MSNVVFAALVVATSFGGSVDDRSGDVADVPPPPLTTAPATSAPPPPPPPPATAPAPQGPLRVSVLPVSGAGLATDEVNVLTKLIAIRAERVGLIVVEGQQHGDIELRTEHAQLGDADVLTVEALVTSSHVTLRDATSARNRGELAEKIGPVVDGLLARALASFPPLVRPDVKRKMADARVDVCDDGGGWFFCDSTRRAVTENEFVRRYRSETNRHDLDVAEVDREPSYEPWIFLIAGGATALATVGATVAIGSTAQGQAFARQTDDAWIVLPVLGLSGSLGLLVYGAIELDDTPTMHDGNELQHLLREEDGRHAARTYNDAVKRRLEREAGIATPTTPAWPPPPPTPTSTTPAEIDFAPDPSN